MKRQETRSITLSLPAQMVEELDRVRNREGRSRSELLSEALRRYLTIAERSHTIPVSDALPEEIEAIRRAEEEYRRGECVRLEDLQNELGLKSR
jgi:metal-responsive CopG/Arc/MetJ family transcriptional regulator